MSLPTDPHVPLELPGPCFPNLSEQHLRAVSALELTNVIARGAQHPCVPDQLAFAVSRELTHLFLIVQCTARSMRALTSRIQSQPQQP